MADSLKQPDGQADSLAASGLNMRLMRRATEPLGVIDVTYAQRKYFRLVRWLAERTALLDRVRTLYGVDEALITGGHPFALQHPVSQQVDVFSTTIRSFSLAAEAQAPRPDVQQQHNVGWDTGPSSLAEIIDERSTKPAGEPDASPEVKFRISRRPPPIQAGSEAELSVHRPRATAKVQSSAADHSASSPQSHPDAKLPDALPVIAVQQPHDAQAEAPITNPVPSDLVFKRSIVERSVVDKGEVIKSTSTQEKRATVTVSNAQGDAPPLPGGGAAVSVGRQSNREIAGDQSTDKTQASPLPLIKPLAGDSVSIEMEEMVWRKPDVSPQAADSMAQGSSASELANSIQSGQGAFTSRAQQSGRIGVQANPQVRTDEVRVEQISPQVISSIAERVIRAITLDLKLERERRGVPKWR